MALMQLLLKQNLLQVDVAGQFQKMDIISVLGQAAQSLSGILLLNILKSWSWTTRYSQSRNSAMVFLKMEKYGQYLLEVISGK